MPVHVKPIPYRVIGYPRFRFWLLTLFGEIDFVDRMKAKIDEINRAEKTAWIATKPKVAPRPQSRMPVLFPQVNGPNSYSREEIEEMYHKNRISPVNPDVQIQELGNGRRLIKVDVSKGSKKKVSEKLTKIRDDLKNDLSGVYDQDLNSPKFRATLNEQLALAGLRTLPDNVITNRRKPIKKEEFPLDGIGDSKFSKKPSRRT